MPTDINSLSGLQALKFFLLKEKFRHERDIFQIDKDLLKLQDIDVPRDLTDLMAWYEVAPTKGASVPQTGTYPKAGE